MIRMNKRGVAIGCNAMRDERMNARCEQNETKITLLPE